MKAKSRSRLMILVGVTTTLVLLLAGVWVARRYQVRRTYDRYRADGMAAAAAGRNDDAIQLLARYLGRNPSDVDVMIALAHARENVPLPKVAHLIQAAQILRQVIRIDPKRSEQQRELLVLYGKLGPSAAPESVALADDLLKANPNDLDALRQRAVSLASMRKVDDALSAARAWADADKSNPEAHLSYVALLLASKNGAAATEYADSLSAQQVGQTTQQIVRALTLLQIGRQEDAKTLLLQVAASQPKDKTTVFLASDGLERLGLAKDSVTLLQRAAGSGNDEIRQRLLRRLWQMGDLAAFLELVGTPAELPESQWAEETALKLISLRRLDHKAEADTLEQALKARPGEFATAWASAVAELSGLEPDPTTAVTLRDKCQAALAIDLENPFLTECLADSLRVLGQDGDALLMFMDVANRNPSWLIPILRATQLQMARGRIQEAWDVATLGLSRAPQNVHMAAILANVWDVAIEQKIRADDTELLKFVERIQQAVPGEETSMAVYIRRLAVAGKTDEAKAVLDKAISQKQAPSSEAVALNWAQLSLQFKLGLEERCIDRSESTFGVTPQSAFFRSYLMFSADRAEDGLKLLRSSASAPDTKQKDPKPWRLSEARYLDLMQSPDALGSWAKLCDDYAKDLDVQQTLLASPSVRQDRQLQERAIHHVELISGKESQFWKLEHSRLLVTGSFSEQDAREAAVLLNEILKSSPDLVEPRFLLARCLEKLKNLSQAIEQLSTAQKLAKTSAGSQTIALYLAQLLQESGDFGGAKQQLDRLASGGMQDPEERRRMGILLARQGDAMQAADMLQPIEGKSREADLLLADMYYQSNQSDRAVTLAKKLMQSPDLAAARLVADLYAAMGREEDAEKVLAKMDEMKGDPSDKQIIRANFQMKRGNPELAIEILRKAVADDPTKPLAWRALVSSLLLQSNTSEAMACASEGLKHVPGDPILAGVIKRAPLIRAAADRGLMPLSIALVQSPDDAALVDAATLLTAADADSPSRAMVYLSQLGDRYPHSLPVQLVVTDRYLLFHHPREAALLASRATQAFPFSPEPPKLAAQCYAELANLTQAPADWTQALAMAKIWRQRDTAHLMAADFAIAKLLGQMGQHDAAAAALEPYIAAASKNPENSAAVVAQYALALCRAGKIDRAEASLQPLLGGGGPIFQAWLQTAASQLPREQAEIWVERLTKSSDNSLTSTMSLTLARASLAARFKDPHQTSKAVALLDELSKRPELSVAQLLTVGMDLESLGEVQLAEQIYLKINPKDDAGAIARNNLAMILARRGDSAAAISLAESAVQSARGRTYALDTLAFAQRKAKNLGAAEDTLRTAIRLEPWSADLRMTLTEILIDAVKLQEARKELAAVEEMLSASGNVPPTIKQRIETLRKSLEPKPSAQSPQTQPAAAEQASAIGVRFGAVPK